MWRYGILTCTEAMVLVKKWHCKFDWGVEGQFPHSAFARGPRSPAFEERMRVAMGATGKRSAGRPPYPEWHVYWFLLISTRYIKLCNNLLLLFKTRVGMYIYYYFLPRFTVSCMKLVIFLLYINLFIYQILCTLIYHRRSLYSFLLHLFFLPQMIIIFKSQQY